MALSVKLNNGLSGGSEVEYSIICETIEHSMIRTATQAGLPAEYVFVLDLGMQIEMITITGVCDNSISPTKSELRTVAKTWYSNINYSDNSGMPELTLASGETYIGVIKSVSFRQESGKEDRWEFSLIFMVKELL